LAVEVEVNGEKASGNSILGLMALGAGYGSKMSVTIVGTDAPQAMAAVEHLFKTHFEEAYTGRAEPSTDNNHASRSGRFRTAHSILSVLFGSLCIAGLLTCGESRAGTIHYVSPGGNDSNAGTSWALAKQSIQAAVDNAAVGDTVLVTNGVYLLSNPIKISNAIQLSSVNGSGATVLDGQKIRRCVTIDSVAATVSGFTIRNGRAVVGGGVYCNEGTLQSCLVVSNLAVGDDFNDGQGGGIYLAYGVVSNCVILSNAAESTNAYQGAWGGGAYCYGGVMQGCVVSNNLCRADNVFGAGVALSGGELRNSRVTGNLGMAVSGAAGGGIYATIMQLSAPSLVDSCVVSDNTVTATDSWSYTTASAQGGGLSIGNSTTIRNSLIVRNSAKAVAGFTSGGGVWTSGSTIESCTVVDNNSTTQNGNPGRGGGVTWGYNDRCYNNIIRFNSADNGPDNSEVNPFSYPMFVNSDIGPSVPVTNTLNCTSADPLFVNASEGNYQLQPGSPCLNFGTNLAWMAGALDLAGTARLSAGLVDLGCYEQIVGGNPPTLVALSQASTGKYEFLLNGTPGRDYTIEYSLTLTNWISLLVTNAPGGQMRIIDTNATNDLRFYRVLN
jgi:hypothetical protein